MKIVLIGITGVGKLSLVKRFVEGTFVEGDYSSKPFYIKKIKINDNLIIDVHLWIHKSSEKYFELRPFKMLFKEANAIILVYDVSEKYSLEKLSVALEHAYNYIPKDFPIILIGNKIDILKNVTTEEGQAFANNNSLFAFYETSAKENINVNECFNKIIEEILKKDANFHDIEIEKEKEKEKEKIIKIEKKRNNKDKKKYCVK